MKEYFENILDRDEEIIKVYKPNKSKYFFSSFLVLAIFSLFVSVILLISLTFNYEVNQTSALIPALVTLAVLILLFVLAFFLVKTSYNKRYYALTNKRILIRGGLIGVDYKGLDLKMIGATEVRVDFLDKLLARNTGTLKFGSQSSPLNAQGSSMFMFNGITEPYQVYKEIKEYIDEVKEK